MAGTCGALMLFLLPRTLRWERVRDGRGLGAPPDGCLRCSVHMRVVQIYVVLTNAWNQLDLSRVWRPVAWVVGARGSWASGVARGCTGQSGAHKVGLAAGGVSEPQGVWGAI